MLHAGSFRLVWLMTSSYWRTRSGETSRHHDETGKQSVNCWEIKMTAITGAIDAGIKAEFTPQTTTGRSPLHGVQGVQAWSSATIMAASSCRRSSLVTKSPRPASRRSKSQKNFSIDLAFRPVPLTIAFKMHLSQIVSGIRHR